MILRAEENQYQELTDISFGAKRYWDYPSHFYEIWKDELTITKNYITSNEVYIHKDVHRITGYYSLVILAEPLKIAGVKLTAGLWLDHMFVTPSLIGQGIGRKLFNHCIKTNSAKKHDLLHILADPYALEFYQKMGCRKISEFPSTIAGRTTPYLHYSLSTKNGIP